MVNKMEDFLSALDELTSSWHWMTFSGSNLFRMQQEMVDFFTKLQEKHRIEVASTSLTTVPTGRYGDDAFLHSALVSFKRYDKSKL